MDSAHLSGDLLCDLAEGQLAPAQRREAEAHIQGCADCRRELDVLQGYFQDMSSLETIKAPDRFLTKVHGRIVKASPWKRVLALLSSPRLMPVPVAAFCLMMVGAFLVYLSRKAEQGSPRLAVASAPASPQAERPASEAAEGERIASYQAPKSADAPTPAAPAPVKLAMKPAAPVARSNRQQLALSDSRLALAEESKKVETPAVLKLSKSKEAGRKAGDPVAKGAAEGMVNEQIAAASPAEKDASPSAGKADREETGRLALAPAAEPESRPERAAAPRSMAKSKAPAPAASSPVASSAPASVLMDDESTVALLDSDAPAAIAGSGHGSEKRISAAGAPPAVTPVIPKPWAPLAYTLTRVHGRADGEAFRSGLAGLGVRVLRHEEGAMERYEIEVPAVKVARLEEYLRGYGALVPSTKAFPGKKDGAPLLMTLRITVAR